jgi:hypothetical protein
MRDSLLQVSGMAGATLISADAAYLLPVYIMVEFLFTMR